ncbi:MAG: hypothetical protein FJ146_19600 [Deltaproteobacteria bacterium]|nr:hypothetical protein [Deltaproteobacteria bacterium]
MRLQTAIITPMIAILYLHSGYARASDVTLPNDDSASFGRATSTDLSPSLPEEQEYTDDQTHEAMGTYFGGIGAPAGGCGLPQSVVESSNFVALNVQSAQPPITGEFNQGRNCGRWIEVTLSKFCKNADHSDRWNTDFCNGGQWEEGPLTGSKALFIVADSCNDGNYWCRNDRYHLDLSASGLVQFGSGVNVSTWRNPQLTWRYVDAPNYSGDVQIGFAQNASSGWPTILIKHLQRGIHKIEQWVGGRWVAQPMFLTLGQVYTLTNVGSEPYRIRLFDARDEPVQNGRVYQFNIPTNCCGRAFNEVAYTTQ